MSYFQSNKFYFIFSDESIKRIDEYFSDFKYLCLKQNLLFETFDVNSKKDFVTVLKKIETECKDNGIMPFIHFECHGSEKGITLKSSAKIYWNEFSNYLTRININCRNNLFISFSSCFGGYFILSLIQKTGRGMNFRTPVYGMIGPAGEIKYKEIEKGFNEFFVTILTKDDIELGIKKLNENIVDSAGYVFTTCEGLLKKLLDGFVAVFGIEKLGSK